MTFGTDANAVGNVSVNVTGLEALDPRVSVPDSILLKTDPLPTCNWFVCVFPFICNLEVGLVVPIPTLTPEVAELIPVTDPSTMQLLQSTRALAPIAVALIRSPVCTSADVPKAEL